MSRSCSIGLRQGGSPRREPGALARSFGESATEAVEGAAGRASRRIAIPPGRRLDRRASSSGKRRRTRPRIPDLDRGAARRGHRRATGTRSTSLIGSGPYRPAHEIGSRAPGAVERPGAITIIEKMQAVRVDAPSVFPSSKPRSKDELSPPLSLALKKAGKKVTMHGFRCHRFGIGAPSRPRFRPRSPSSPSLIRSATKVEQAYMRSDLFEKRRQLAAAWARYCDTPAAEGRVVPMRQTVVAE